MSIALPARPTKETTLAEFVDEYVSVRDLAPGSVESIRYSVKILDRWHGKPVRLCDLSDVLLNQFLTARLATSTSVRTCRGQRGAILSLWNEAAYLKLAPPPDRIKLPRVRCQVPQAWDQPTVRRIIEAAGELPGLARCGVPRGKMMRALCLTAWHSGLRPCDLITLRADQVDASGVLVTVQQKTNVPIKCTLAPEVLEAIGQTFPPMRELIFPFGRKAVDHWWWRLKRAAGVPGSFKWFRRSAATAVESEHPGAAMRFLGHLTPGLAWKHYLDLRLINLQKPQPPSLGISPADDATPTPEAEIAPLLQGFAESSYVEQHAPCGMRKTLYRVRRLVADCKMRTLADVTAAAVAAYLDGLEAVSRENYRRAIQAFAAWCIDQGKETEELQALAVRKPGGVAPKGRRKAAPHD